MGFYVLDILGRPLSRIPDGGRPDHMEDIRMPVAGAGATAVGCAILGLKTQAVTTVGDDEMGDFLVAKMEKFGVDCHMVARDGSVQTSATILPVRPNGERPALHVPGTVATFTVPPDKLDAALDARIVHVGGTGPLKSFDGEPSVALLRRAKELQRTTTFDFIQATPETFAFVKPTLPYVDYFVPSIEEASEMAGRADPQKVAQFYKDLGARNVLLTMGGNGVYVSRESDEAFQLRAHAIKVVDTTGRGDSFTAGIIVGLVHDRTLKSGARFASTVAAKVAMGLNSDGKLKSFEDTVAAMKSWPLRRAA